MIDRQLKDASFTSLTDLLTTAEWTQISRVNSQLRRSLVSSHVVFQLRTQTEYITASDVDDDDEIAYFTVRWKTRASFVYRTKNVDNDDKDSKNRKWSH